MNITHKADDNIYNHIKRTLGEVQFREVVTVWIKDGSYGIDEFTRYIREKHPEVFQQFIGYITAEVLTSDDFQRPQAVLRQLGD